jgi:hypothetical protein
MNLSLNLLLAALAAALILALVTFLLGILLRRRPGKLKREQYVTKWQDLQKNCANQATWPLAIIDADKLLDDALKKLHYRGKTMGERLVAAQRDIRNNDSVWFGHKLRNKIVHEDIKLGKRQVMQALQGFRDALKDLGAL